MTPNFARLGFIAALSVCAATIAASPVASQEASHSITIRDHQFVPSTVTIKAGTKVRLSIVNAQKVAAEFESNDLNREKVIPAGSTAIIYIGPLEPGSYSFFDDFHAATKGRIVAK